MHKQFVIILSLLLIFSGCNKKDRVEISGKMFDPNMELPIEGVSVELWTQLIESGIYSANYTHMATELSGADGQFNFDIANKNWAAVRLAFSKEGYYGWENNVNMEGIKNERASFEVYQMLPKAWIHFTVENMEPFDNEDYFEFRIMNGYTACEECCQGEKFQFMGREVNQEITCQVTGHQDILIQWSMRKNGEQIYQTDTHFITAFDTTEVRFLY